MIAIGPVTVCGALVVAARPIADVARVPAWRGDVEAARAVPETRRAEHVAARTLLRLLLAEVLDPVAAASPISTRTTGQPFLSARPDVGVSVSHSHGWVAAAVHPGRTGVGVDVQVPVRVGDAIVRRCCTTSAAAALGRLGDDERDLEFAWIWSVQEACVKAVGTGIVSLSCTVPVEVGQARGVWRDTVWSALREIWPVPVSCAHTREAACPRVD